jgi:uncharacterized protein with HEPN domain
MRREALYLSDILEAIDTLGAFLEGKDLEAFLRDPVLQSAALQKLTVIGEAAARLPPELKSRHPEVPWSRIVGFRNVAVHAYFSVQWPTVWTTATEDAPALRSKIQAILESESRQPGG